MTRWPPPVGRALAFGATTLLCAAVPASAQSVPVLPDRTPVEASPPARVETNTPAWVLMDLPSNGSLYSVLETIQPDVVSNRIEGGGMYAGTAPHIGAHGSTWTQTHFRVGDINLSDPDGSGTPLALPGVLELERIDVNTGIMGIDVNAPGLVVNLTPRRPSRTWIKQIEASSGPSGLQAGSGGRTPPAIARLSSYGSGTVLLSGPLRERLGMVFVGTYRGATRYERDDPTALRGGMTSGFAHLVYTKSPRDEVRTVVWAQRSTTPVERPLLFADRGAQESATSLSLQTTWERSGGAQAPSWRAYSAVSLRDRSQDAAHASVLSIERLTDPPPWENTYPGPGTNRSWQIGARMAPVAFTKLNRRHDTIVGFDLSGGSARQNRWFDGRIGELVNGIPARVWDFTSTGATSKWGQTTFAVYAADRLVLRPRLNLTAGLRLEHLVASAEGAATGVSWTSLMPRVGLQWDFTSDGRLDWFINFGQYGYEMRLRDLSYGDPSAATADVYQWNAPPGTTLPQASAIGPLVKRWGPGTGGNPDFSAVHEDLHRPLMNEAVTGFGFRPKPGWVMRVSGIARVDKNLITVTNPGVPFSAYTRSTVDDPGVDIDGGTTPQPLPIYNRPVSTFGADRYLLTNNAEIEAFFHGVDITTQVTTEKIYLLIGATAGRAEGWASNRGYHDYENDIGVLGEGWVDPNANTFAKARPFTERGYTIRASGVYHFARNIRLGVAARYQDGQHFSRMVIAPDLNQGAEMVRAFGSGETRFTFTGTLDTRLQKGFMVSGYNVDAILDVYNLLNLGLEVEEVTVSGPTSRDTSAKQPPRALHIGVRVRF